MKKIKILEEKIEELEEQIEDLKTENWMAFQDFLSSFRLALRECGFSARIRHTIERRVLNYLRLKKEGRD